ncbi:uncharacterized protein LOC127881338 isoform X2 [Dreissena polymorpha]|uniref:uncharacterized protein LOC127881338 isoform X2 n=1 Tax=Dreissena polymorpha TaxID=45954 RepID=UPI0022649CFC|nr:uncharacterized protein LOC127881338 isoform X2 [Dreissena polymorpha]
MEERLRTKEMQNWLKCWIATFKIRDVIAQLAKDGFEAFYDHIRRDMSAKHGINEADTCSRHAVGMQYSSKCSDQSKCRLCFGICQYIWDNHRFKKGNLKGPSWSNTDYTKWCTDAWQLAKCYMAATGYKDVLSAYTTDFNGIVGALYNCTWMQNYFTDDLSQTNNICTKAREKVNSLRHIHDTIISDVEMNEFFDCLLDLLNDPSHMSSFQPAVDACNYLIEIQQDSLPLSNQTIKDTMAKLYEKQKEDFRGYLIAYYRRTLSTVPISPLWEGLDKPIVDIFVTPLLVHIDIEKDGSRRKTDDAVKDYKNILFNDEILNTRVIMQGEPGIGKTTLLAKFVLDWCEAVHPKKPEYHPSFPDVDTLTEFGFLFHIALRDAEGQREVVEMIKTQVIDRIYTAYERDEIFTLLQTIMKREKCIVVMDGLNEWVDPLNRIAIPVMVTSHTQCVALISTRPWKMTDERIKVSEIDTFLEVDGIIEPKQLTEHILRCCQTANIKTYTEFMIYVNDRSLQHFITSPWLHTLLVALWVDDNQFSGSLCELNCILMDRLFKKANSKKGYFKKEHPMHCLAHTSYIEPQVDIIDALGKAAFEFTFSSTKSFVFTERELMNYLSREQLQFCLQAGVLSGKCSSILTLQNSQMSFLHETIQEFLSAYHIVQAKKDIIQIILSKNKYSLLELSQIIIYLCGLNIEIANKAIESMFNLDLINEIREGIRIYMKGAHAVKALVFKKDEHKGGKRVTLDFVEMAYDGRCLALVGLFQQMIISCYYEATISGHNDICLKFRDFIFNNNLNNFESSVLKTVLMNNKSNVRSLISEHNVLQMNEILTIIRASIDCIERIEMPAAPELYNALCGSENIEELTLTGKFDGSLISKVLLSMSKLTYLNLKESYLKEPVRIPVTIQHVCLFQSEISLDFLQQLLVQISAQNHSFQCDLYQVTLINCEAAVTISNLLDCDMSNLTLCVNNGSIELYNLLRGTTLGKLMLETSGDFEMALVVIPTLSWLTNLRLWGTFTGRCCLRIPASFPFVALEKVECSTEWLCSFLITLSSSLGDYLACCLSDVLLQSTEGTCDEAHVQGTDLRSEILSCDMSNFSIYVCNGSVELFEILRDTSIGTLGLMTAECASLASDILNTLNKLATLDLWGTYTGQCDLQMPASLKNIHLQQVECSSEWLCSLLLTLSSLERPLSCQLFDFVLQSSAVSDINASELRTKISSLDMSNIEVIVNNVNMELFEILRDTSIGILDLRTGKCVALASNILHTLNRLRKLYLYGMNMGRCDLRIPASLQYIRLKKIECPSELICNLLITLSTMNNPVRFELVDVVLKSCEEACEGSDIRASDLRAPMLSSDMSKITIRVENVSTDLFELFRDTSIGILAITDCYYSRASNIVHTLNKLTRLCLSGKNSGRYDLILPCSLQCIVLQKVKCSSEWLLSLFITLLSLERPISCQLVEFVLQSGEEVGNSVSEIYLSELRSEILSRDMSNVEIVVKNVNKELFEILRDTSIGILDLRTAECVSFASDILHTLNRLTTIYMCEIDMGRSDLRLPASLKYISLKGLECSIDLLCNLLITLSTIHHPVKLDLLNVVLQSGKEVFEASVDIVDSDLRASMLSCDMSAITIWVENGSKDLFEIVRDTSIGILVINECILQASHSVHTLCHLTKLSLLGNYTGRFDLKLPVSLKCIILQDVKCSTEWLCSFLITLSALNCPVRCELFDVVLQSCEEACVAGTDIRVSDLRGELLSRDMSKITICVENGTLDLFDMFRCTSIGNLELVKCVSNASNIVHTLNHLTSLSLLGNHTGRFDLKLPVSLQCILLQKIKCSTEWLCSCFITLSALNHPVRCLLLDVVLLSCDETCGPGSDVRVSQLRTEILSLDMSKITVNVQNGTSDLFEIFRRLSIRGLAISKCVLQASDIVHTLNKLTKLMITGNYTGRCNLKLPSSLQCIVLQEVECSSEWLFSLLITLSSLQHPISCQLLDFVLRSSEVVCCAGSEIHVSELQPEILSRDMSNIEIIVKNVNMQLFEILRDTTIGILDLRTAECFLLASDILHTLNRLTKLIVWGAYAGRFDLQLPTSLNYMCLQDVECSSEWLCSLLIKLSSFNHHLECALWHVQLRPSGDVSSDIRVSGLRSEMLKCDMSNITILFKYGSMDLFDILMHTNIRILILITADCFVQMSSVLPTLCKLKKLCLHGKYMGRCVLKLPASMKCVRLQNVKCSSEWLCSLLITLSSLDHPVKCELMNVVVQANEEGEGSDKHVSDLRNELSSISMSNIKVFVTHGRIDGFELLRDSNTATLYLKGIATGSFTADILHTINKLTKLYLRGIYTGLQLPASLQSISLLKVECASERLCRLLISILTLGHSEECDLLDLVLKSRAELCGTVSDVSDVSDLRSEILICDMSNIIIFVKNGSVELFKQCRDTNITVLKMRTIDLESFTAGILNTLNKLTTLYMWGTYRGRCCLNLQATLKCLSLQEVECSAEWLCSLLIKLSSFDHPVACELWDVVLLSNEETSKAYTNMPVSDLQSELLSRDMSNIKITIKGGSIKLFEILRGSNIWSLSLRTVDNFSKASESIYTLNRLTHLYLWGNFTGFCYLKFPSSIQCLSLHVCKCSSEWLCGLLIGLSSLDHPVVCQLWDVVVQSIEESVADDSRSDVPDFRSALLSCDLKHIEVLVKKGSIQLFEMLRDSSIGIMSLKTAECAALASDILHTLRKLSKLSCWGTYKGRCDLKLPDYLKSISLQNVKCSTEWLCSLLIILTTFVFPVTCELWDVVLLPSENAHADNTNVSDLQTEILSRDMSNIKIDVNHCSVKLFEILRSSSIGKLNLRSAEWCTQSSDILNTLSKITEINIWGTYIGRLNLKLPASLQYLNLQKVECSSEWLCSLLITLSSVDHHVGCTLWDVELKSSEKPVPYDSHVQEHDLRSEKLSCDMSNIDILVDKCNRTLFQIFRESSIGILRLKTSECAELASDILPTLSKLKKLYSWGIYTGPCNLKLPACLQIISLQNVRCSTEWLCSLMITLTASVHPVTFELWDVVLLKSENADGENLHLSDLQSEILSRDLSNIKPDVTHCCMELFELLRCSSVRILTLRTAECLLQASDILGTLSQLTELHIWGAYTGRHNLKLPASLQCLRLQKVECSSEWLCSLLISLSSINHSLDCAFWDVVLQSGEHACVTSSDIQIPDFRSELLLCDMSKIMILVEKSNVELFKQFRNTSIGRLWLKTADSVTFASEILHTLNKLTQLILCGTYTGRCNLKLPASLQCFLVLKCECSSEWLCSLLKTLSSLDHPVECELFDVVLQSGEYAYDTGSDIQLSYLRSELLLCDMSKITIYVKNGTVKMFELFRDTNLRILKLQTADSASLASEILHTLNKLTHLYFLGTYSGRCHLQLPSSLQFIYLQESELSTEWLCSLLIKISSLDHTVLCHVVNVLLKPSESIFLSNPDTHVYTDDSIVSDVRSEMMSRDMANIELEITNGSCALYEMLCDTGIRNLYLGTTEDFSLASTILSTLTRLKNLYIWGTYNERFEHRFPTSLEGMSLQQGTCSEDWIYGVLTRLSALQHSVRFYLFECSVLLSGENSEIYSKPPKMKCAELSNVKLEVMKDCPGFYEMLSKINITSLNMTQIEHANILVKTLPFLTHLEQLRICLDNYDVEMRLPISIKTFPSSMEDPFPTRDSQVTLTSWVESAVNLKIAPTDSMKEHEHTV